MKKLRDENFISLGEATKYCNYSQEYLSLRVRQGKLKGIKLGRNWVTKKEWVIEYIEGVVDTPNGKESKIQFIRPEAEKYQVESPAELPIGQFEESVQNLFISKRPKFSKLKFSILFFFVSTILLAETFYYKEAVGSVAYNSLVYANKVSDKIIGPKGKYFISESFKKSKYLVSKISRESKSEISGNPFFSRIYSFYQGLKNISGKYWNFAKTEMFFLAVKARDKLGPFAVLFFEKKNNLTQENFDQTQFLKEVKNGLVVVPADEKQRKELKKKIEDSFSDQVQINPIDETSGVIIPIFKERKGSEYMYVLVPTDKK